eukprot:Em0003g1374a
MTDTTESSAQSLVLCIPRRSAPVTDISVWVECFTLMAAVLAAKYPSRAPDLLMYLHRIVYCARKFEGHAWVTYDRLYRRQTSANRSLNWAAEDQALYNEAFARRAKPTSRCKICLSEHHGTDACPDSTRPLFAHQEPDCQRQAPPQEICRQFNENRCFVRLCKYRHACSTCGAPHPALSCGQRNAPENPYDNRDIRRPAGRSKASFCCQKDRHLAHYWETTPPRELEDHPDRRYSDYITNGLAECFRVGFDHRQQLRSATHNLPSVCKHDSAVSSYINTELSANLLLGPLPSRIARYTHRSRIGVVPKGHNYGSCGHHQPRSRHAAGKNRRPGHLPPHPRHPDDRPLLGIEWKGSVYCDAMLPFGLRSAAKIFSAVADALEWILRRKGVDHMAHYLDDFINLGTPHSSQCADSLRIVVDTCAELGVPLALDKCEGPSTCLTFLGIELDTETRTLRLPRDKLPGHSRDVAREETNDRMLAANWNGTGLIPQDRITPTITLYTDAAGSWGCGASWNQQWFQVQWSESATLLPISVKEMLPIIMTAATWGAQWHSQLVACYCDNQAVVATLATRSSKEEQLANLLRCLFYFKALFQFELRGIHIPGAQNQAADALSRNRIDVFFQQVPKADLYLHPIPSRLVEILLSEDIDWLSPLRSVLLRARPSRVNASNIRFWHETFPPFL